MSIWYFCWSGLYVPRHIRLRSFAVLCGLVCTSWISKCTVSTFKGSHSRPAETTLASVYKSEKKRKRKNDHFACENGTCKCDDGPRQRSCMLWLGTLRRAGNENVASKVNLRSFSFQRNHSNLLTLSNVGEPFWSWIPRGHIQIQKEK